MRKAERVVIRHSVSATRKPAGAARTWPKAHQNTLENRSNGQKHTFKAACLRRNRNQPRIVLEALTTMYG